MQKERPLHYTEMEKATKLSIAYTPRTDGGVLIEARSEGVSITSAQFSRERIDEAHILYMEAIELIPSRVAIGQESAEIRKALETLFALFRGEKIAAGEVAAANAPHTFSQEFVPNPGKKIEIDVDGVVYQRLPVKTRTITLRDTDLLPLIEEYAAPHLKAGDMFFISEKALCIAQGRVVDMSDVKPGWLARLFARNVSNDYGSQSFKGFGHGTSLAMQLFIEEAGVVRVLFAAFVSALTRPLGIRGLFYTICGVRAKSIDCPMSFLILEYAHSAKLAPEDPSGAARRVRARFGPETVILDANYRGAFSLGKSTDAISESFIGKLFRDNPLGQSDEMTPFCIVRKAETK